MVKIFTVGKDHLIKVYKPLPPFPLMFSNTIKDLTIARSVSSPFYPTWAWLLQIEITYDLGLLILIFSHFKAILFTRVISTTIYVLVTPKFIFSI